MPLTYTPAQKQRLHEFGVKETGIHFDSYQRRRLTFENYVNNMSKLCQNAIRDMVKTPSRHILSRLENDIASHLIENGFIEVKTPTIISTASLNKMGIGGDHPLHKQVFHLDNKKCMRPMLAPNLYKVMGHMRRSVSEPLKLFEIGPCYRKESRSSDHMSEFTMLNIVILGPEMEAQQSVLDIINEIMGFVGLDYDLSDCESDVYQTTIDVEVSGHEVASAAIGPHILDSSHGIDEPWCGVGFGLERLLMLKEKKDSVKRVGRNLVYQNGIRIDI